MKALRFKSFDTTNEIMAASWMKELRKQCNGSVKGFILLELIYKSEETEERIIPIIGVDPLGVEICYMLRENTSLAPIIEEIVNFAIQKEIAQWVENEEVAYANAFY